LGIFGSIVKLQPFEDGNKRSAIIFANVWNDKINSDEIITLPTRNEFDKVLVSFYKGDISIEVFIKDVESMPTGSDD
jgi:prophage maintenance system killer protein